MAYQGAIWACLFVMVTPAAAQELTPDQCVANLSEARNQLAFADFESAIQLIQPCIESNLLTAMDDQVQAYELLAIAYLTTGSSDEARVAVVNILNMNPGYVPDSAIARSDYVALVNEMKAQTPPEPPPLLSARTTDVSVTLRWAHLDVDQVSEYVVYRGDHPENIEAIDTLEVTTLQLVTVPVEQIRPEPLTFVYLLENREQTGDVLQITTDVVDTVMTAEVDASRLPSNRAQIVSYSDQGLQYDINYYYAVQAVKANDISSAPIDAMIRIRIPGPETAEAPSRTSIPRWVFIGGGVLAGGALTAVLASGGGGGGGGGNNGGGGDLPTPPDLPTPAQ